MPLFNSSLITSTSTADSTPADPVTRSLRFESGGRLTRTFSSSNRRTFTISFWAKRGSISSSSDQQVFSVAGSGHSGGADIERIHFTNDDTIEFWAYPSSTAAQINVSAKLRDPSAWAHYMMSVDTTQSTASDRIKFFINGVHQTALDNSTYPSQNYEFYINSNKTHYIGEEAIRHRYPYSGLLADFYFIDGTALSTPVGNLIQDTGYSSYKPKAFDMSSYSGNSFHIDAQPAHDADLLVTSVGRNGGDTDFVDVAAGHTVSRYGHTEHSIKVGNPFTGDGRAIYFDGSDDYLTVDDGTNIDLGTGDFTIEFWVNSEDSTQNSFITGRWDATPNTGDYLDREWGLTCSSYGGGELTVFHHYVAGTYNAASVNVCDGKWHHIAIVRHSGDAKLYVDGEYKIDASVLDTLNMSYSSKLLIGAGQSQGGWQGAIYDYRISDTARYTSGTSSFDVPTTKFTSDSNTLLLIQPDRDDTTFHDESSSPATVTTVSSPTRTASTPFDAAAKSTAMYFDGSGDYLTVPTHADLKPESGDFTVEAWINYSSIPDSTYGSVIYGVCGGAGGPSGDSLAFMLKPDGHLGLIYGDSHYAGSSATAMSANTWYHVALVRSSGTVKLYIDGDEDYSATHSGNLNNTTDNRIGARGGTAMYLDGYIYDLRFTKGTARYTSNFTAPSAPFELNPVGIGGDQSGNKNHFQPTNISQTHDVMLDVPTKNYATLNPVSDVVASGSNTFSEGNLTLNPSYAFNKAASTIAVSSGKWYAEVRYDSAGNQMAGIGRVDCLENTSNYIGQSSSAFGYVIYRPTGDMYHNSSTTSIFSSISSGDILQIALDLDSNTVWWGLNGTWVGTVGSSGGTSITAAEYYFVQTYRNPCTWNFGQDNTFAGQFTGTPNNAEFAYEIPTDSSGNPFKSLNTSNLADPAANPAENFGVSLYNGNSSSNAITGLGFEPSLLWTKSRSTSGTSHKIYDSVRGVTKKLEADNTTTEGTVSSDLTSLDSDGFTLGSGSGSNYSGRTYVGWNWKAHQGGPVTRSHTMTLEVDDLWGSGSDWGNTKLEVWEGATKLKDITQPAYNGGSSTTWTIKTNDTDKIKVVWDVDSSMDWTAMYAVLKNSSNTTLASWDGNSYYGGSTPADGSNFYIPSGHDSSNAAVTGVVESSSPTVESYNSAAGFTMIKYAGDGSTDGDTQALDHSLGVPLEFVIAKKRTSNDGYDNGDWIVWHKDLSSSKYLYLNSTSAQRTEASGYNLISTTNSGTQHQVVVNNGTDNSSYNYHYLNSGPANGTGEDYILYGWAGVEGFSKFGTYKGAGSNGVFVYTGHRPKMVWIKNIDTTGNWFIFDAVRDTYNETVNYLHANSSASETTNSGYKIDILSNGFRIKVESTHMNNSAYDYVFCSWAETPFSKANAR